MLNETTSILSLVHSLHSTAIEIPSRILKEKLKCRESMMKQDCVLIGFSKNKATKGCSFLRVFLFKENPLCGMNVIGPIFSMSTGVAPSQEI